VEDKEGILFELPSSKFIPSRSEEDQAAMHISIIAGAKENVPSPARSTTLSEAHSPEATLIIFLNEVFAVRDKEKFRLSRKAVSCLLFFFKGKQRSVEGESIAPSRSLFSPRARRPSSY